MKIFVVTFYWADDGGGRYTEVPQRRDMGFFFNLADAEAYAQRAKELGWSGFYISEEQVK